jgi:hypothetical protein
VLIAKLKIICTYMYYMLTPKIHINTNNIVWDLNAGVAVREFILSCATFIHFNSRNLIGTITIMLLIKSHLPKVICVSNPFTFISSFFRHKLCFTLIFKSRILRNPKITRTGQSQPSTIYYKNYYILHILL